MRSEISRKQVEAMFESLPIEFLAMGRNNHQYFEKEDHWIMVRVTRPDGATLYLLTLSSLSANHRVWIDHRAQAVAVDPEGVVFFVQKIHSRFEHGDRVEPNGVCFPRLIKPGEGQQESPVDDSSLSFFRERMTE